MLVLHRRADAFAALLDTPLRPDGPALLPVAAPPAGWLRRQPGPRSGAVPTDLSSLVGLVGQLTAAGTGAVPPRSDDGTTRRRLVAVATVRSGRLPEPGRAGAGQPGPARIHPVAGARPGLVTAGLLAFSVAVAGTGAVAAGARSTPGDPLWPVKTATEAVALALTEGADEGRLRLSLAGRRLAELEHLADVAGGSWSAEREGKVRRTLARLDGETREGVRLLGADYTATGSAASLRAVAEWTADASARLIRLQPVMPATLWDRSQESLSLLADVEDDLGVLVTACGAGCLGGAEAAGPAAPVGGTTHRTAGTRSAGAGAPAPAPSAGPSGAAVTGTGEVPAGTRSRSASVDSPAPAPPADGDAAEPGTAPVATLPDQPAPPKGEQPDGTSEPAPLLVPLPPAPTSDPVLPLPDSGDPAGGAAGTTGRLGPG